MRFLLQEHDVRFILGLVGEEKDRFEQETGEIEEEIKLLERLLRDWTFRFVNQSPCEFHEGYRYVEDRKCRFYDKTP